jgi:protein-S-isoprenylcysteine O-methyltransferase Ste14
MLRREMPLQGRWLFRWRSYLPILSVAFIVPALENFQYPFGSHLADLIWEGFCLCIGLAGLAIRCLVAGHVPRKTSGRNTHRQIADTLNTTGMYSLIRNPLYLGNLFMWSAVMLFLRHGWFYAVSVLAFILYYERIIADEEGFLAEKFGETYEKWAAATPMMFPEKMKWRQPAMPFSWRSAIRREYHSCYGFVAAMTLMEFAGDIVVKDAVEIDPVWAVFFGIGTAGYLTVRFLVKCTSVLKVEGRT